MPASIACLAEVDGGRVGIAPSGCAREAAARRTRDAPARSWLPAEEPPIPRPREEERPGNPDSDRPREGLRRPPVQLWRRAFRGPRSERAVGAQADLSSSRVAKRVAGESAGVRRHVVHVPLRWTRSGTRACDETMRALLDCPAFAARSTSASTRSSRGNRRSSGTASGFRRSTRSRRPRRSK